MNGTPVLCAFASICRIFTFCLSFLFSKPGSNRREESAGEARSDISAEGLAEGAEFLAGCLADLAAYRTGCGGADGLDFYRSILSCEMLKDERSFYMFEIGKGQYGGVLSLAAKKGLGGTPYFDLSGIKRVIMIR